MPATAATDLLAVELFSSLQGEGLWIGARQIFFRLALCNLACSYCDTDFSTAKHCRLELSPGSGEFALHDNPLPLARVLQTIDIWQQDNPRLHHSFNLTGGEPLCQAPTLVGWLPELARRLPLHLETNATRPAELESLLPWLAFVSLDIKLESVTGQATPWDAHRACLRLSSRLAGQVKCVVGTATTLAEIEQASRLVAETAPDSSLILQPVTIDGRPAVPGHQLLAFQAAGSRLHPHLRIIPQVHPMLNVL